MTALSRRSQVPAARRETARRAETAHADPHRSLRPWSPRRSSRRVPGARAPRLHAPVRGLRRRFVSAARGRRARGETFPSFERGFPAWPVPGTVATSWWMDDEGRLSVAPPAGAGADSFRYDPSRAKTITLPGGGTGWDALPDWAWDAPPQGTALAWETEPLADTLVMAGSGSVDLWLSSTASDTDL
ncbi:hypothetical protein KGQ64_14085, partial [bacterium]|nr:hypothetical protein [bacterium]